MKKLKVLAVASLIAAPVVFAAGSASAYPTSCSTRVLSGHISTATCRGGTYGGFQVRALCKESDGDRMQYGSVGTYPGDVSSTSWCWGTPVNLYVYVSN